MFNCTSPIMKVNYTHGSLLYFGGTSSLRPLDKTMMSAIASVASSRATNLASSCLEWNDLLPETV